VFDGNPIGEQGAKTLMVSALLVAFLCVASSCPYYMLVLDLGSNARVHVACSLSMC
jgi:hypothetical protein